jgi:hypothetical protein
MLTQKRIARIGATALLSALSVMAGPPLICHPFIIGAGKSLPWSTGPGWDSRDARYDVRNLSRDTLNLLTPDTPVIVRMETLRRAAIYSDRQAQAALDLGRQLMARILEAEAAGQTAPMAWFDAGYFVESVRQLSVMDKANPFGNLDGYAWVRKALAQAADRPAVEYSLALMREPWPNDHYRKAVAGAQPGSLLEQNLRKHGNQELSRVRSSQ